MSFGGRGLLHGIGLALVVLGAFLATAGGPAMLPDAVAILGVGLGAQWVAVAPLIEAFRREVGPGRHRA